MAAIELTRMDFHVARFLNSDDVDDMTDKEVGQFCLLLFKAWMIAKDVSLPVDSDRLARYARCDEVSTLVLKQFPIVETEWGQRRRNVPQLEVWNDARARSEAGKKGAEKRWGKQWEGENDASADATALPAHEKPHALLLPISDHTISDHTISEQNKSDQSSVSVSSFHRSANWKNFAIPYRNVFKKKAGTEFKKRYYEACSKYGEDVVLECFRAWATDNQREWCEANGFDRPLNIFFKKLPEEAADLSDLNIAEKEEQTTAAEQRAHSEQIQAESIERQTAETVKFLTSQPPTTTGEGSVEDFLAGE